MHLTLTYTSAPKERGYTNLPMSLRPFFHPYNFFCHSFLSNNQSQCLEISTHSSCRFAIWWDLFPEKFLFTEDFFIFLTYIVIESREITSEPLLIDILISLLLLASKIYITLKTMMPWWNNLNLKNQHTLVMLQYRKNENLVSKFRLIKSVHFYSF